MSQVNILIRRAEKGRWTGPWVEGK